MGPYVNRVDRTSARLLWVSEPGVPPLEVSLEARGRRRTALSVPSAIGGRRELLHTVVLDGLQPSTRYEYRVGSGEGAPAGSFVTAAPPGTPVRFVVYGDTRSYPDRHRQVTAAIAKEDPAFVVCTGDLVAAGQSWDLWKPEFFDPAMAYLSKAALWPVRGTHEQDAVLYRALFDLPGNELYYSFDFGGVHFVVLDSEKSDDDRAMLRWLRRDLASHRSDWTFVAYHTPTFNVGGHGSAWGRDDFLPLLESRGVDFVITGHSHIYERFLPIGPAGAKPVIHIVSGGGGAPLYEVMPSPVLAGGIGSSELHFCVFEVNGDKCDMTVKRPDGSVLDRLSLVKRGGRYQREVEAAALDTRAADQLRLMFVRMEADFPVLPAPDQPVQVVVTARRIPVGASVSVSAPRRTQGGSAWLVEPQTVTVRDGRFAFTARPPADLRADAAGFRPPLRIALTVEDRGRRYAADDLTVPVTDDVIRRSVPAPTPVEVAHAAHGVTVDGDLSEWAGVRPMPLPFQKAGSSSFRLAWSADGFYGAVDAADATLGINLEAPWTADAVELFVEKDFARSLRRTANAAQYILSPAPDTGPGPAHVVTAYGDAGRDSGVRCAWRPTAGGYALEFFIPAATLGPAKMATGSVLGMNFALSDDGTAVQQFYCDKNGDGWQTPIMWGAVRLVE